VAKILAMVERLGGKLDVVRSEMGDWTQEIFTKKLGCGDYQILAR
jgi:hypothetical protein